MSSKKKELEMVYNLEWKNKPANGDEKSNMVGILDIPATTLDWETFKSYLLKNSGVADDNVKVSYIHSKDREIAINSQVDFEIALYTFKHKARMNEIITLKLDCVNSKETSSTVKSIAKGLSEVQVKIRPKTKKAEEPPEWFLIYMKKFKDELIEEISAVCSSKAHQMNMYHTRKLKVDSYKRTRKTPLLLADAVNDKELSKSAKIERKLDSKLEKLEHKTMKIKAKKMALRGSSDSDVGRSSSKNETITYLPPSTSTIMSMNASVIKREGTPHMIGGEPYCQTWEICNSGTLPWTSDTELRYAWGSQALKPLNKDVPCPPLKPGETGTITVFLEIPKMPGTYESYWHFYHKGRRFGHWLGCEIIVDEPPVKNIPYVPSPTYDVINIQDVYELVLPTSWTTSKKSEEVEENPPEESVENDSHKFATCFPLSTFEKKENFVESKEEKESKDVTDANDEIVEQEAKAEMNAFSDSDNQSIVSISDSNSSVNSATSEDFVMLKMSNLPKLELHNVPSVTPNLTKMNVSSLENIDNIDNLFTNLSIDNSSFLNDVEPTDLKVDHGKSSTEREVDVKPDSSNTNDKEDITKPYISTPSNVVQQIPIDLSNKPVVNETENGATDDIGYAYVHYKGRKIPISKKHLSSDFLTTAETVPESEVKNLENFKIEEVIQNQKEQPVNDTDEQTFCTSTSSININVMPQDNKENNFNQQTSSFCSVSMSGNEYPNNSCGMTNSMMTSSIHENRYFVFPQFYPGYEVVPPFGANYVDPSIANTVPFQPIYRYNTVGEVLVNDWATGLNYTTCIRQNTSEQYCGSTGASTPNTTRDWSSIANSNEGTPPNPSPQSSQKDQCSCKSESHIAENNDYHKFGQNVNMNTSFEDSRNSTYSNSNSNLPSENSNATAPTQPKPPRMDSRGNNRGVPDLLSGATVVATSAINTARSVLNMFVPPRSTDCGRWQNGHWISTNPESKREKNLRLLYDMGFYNRDLNATLLARYNDDVNAVVAELLQ